MKTLGNCVKLQRLVYSRQEARFAVQFGFEKGSSSHLRYNIIYIYITTVYIYIILLYRYCEVVTCLVEFGFATGVSS